MKSIYSCIHVHPRINCFYLHGQELQGKRSDVQGQEEVLQQLGQEVGLDINSYLDLVLKRLDIVDDPVEDECFPNNLAQRKRRRRIE